MRAPPEGFKPHFRSSPATEPWEPLYSRRTPNQVEIGLYVTEAHCNSRGFAHGGVVAALADNAMGLALGAPRAEETPRPSIVTVSLSLDYLASAQIGQWLQITPRVLKSGRSMGFVDALVTADGASIARASATFAISA